MENQANKATEMKMSFDQIKMTVGELTLENMMFRNQLMAAQEKIGQLEAALKGSPASEK